MDAINLLKQDHRTVEKMFQAYMGAKGIEEQQQYCRQVCTELNTHATLEEQCFYPQVRTVAGLGDLVDASLQEHGKVKELCSTVQGMQAGDAQLRTRMMELKQAVEHHVKAEETEMFPKVREACEQQWLLTLGQDMEQRKASMAPGEQRVREDVRGEAARKWV
jgi:hemerythrin superfamily protein